MLNLSKFRHFSWHTLNGRTFKILNLCIVLKIHQPVHVKHGNAFVYPRVSARAHLKFNLIMQKGCWVVQMINAHKRFRLFTDFKMRGNIKLRWQWNSVYKKVLIKNA